MKRIPCFTAQADWDNGAIVSNGYESYGYFQREADAKRRCEADAGTALRWEPDDIHGVGIRAGYSADGKPTYKGYRVAPDTIELQ